MEEQAGKQWEASREEMREQLLQLIQRGQDSQSLLLSPVLVGWCRDFQARAYELLDEIPLNDTIARDRIVLSISMLRKLMASLHRYEEEGEISKKDLASLLEYKGKGLLGGLFSE